MRQPKGVEILDTVTAKALGDGYYKERLKADPVAVLREEGLMIGDGIKIVVHENTGDTIHLVLPSELPTSIEIEEIDITIIAHHTGGM
ncbi:MAG: NHLP leader peptide family natural product precursor [Solirubrobacteraceae bacterium]|jgi:hypothetical protein